MMYGSWDMVCDRQMNRQMDRQKKWHGAPPKNENWAYLWINSVTFYTVCFYCMPSWGLSKYIKTKHQTACFYLIQSFFFFFFFKKKRRSGTSFPVSFLHYFWRKIFILLSFITDQISFCCCLFFMRYWVICVLQLFVNQAVTW